LQNVGNVLFDSGWEIVDICISKLGIVEIADIEAELFLLALQFSCFFLCPFLLFVDDVDRGTSSCI